MLNSSNSSQLKEIDGIWKQAAGLFSYAIDCMFSNHEIVLFVLYFLDEDYILLFTKRNFSISIQPLRTQ